MLTQGSLFAALAFSESAMFGSALAAENTPTAVKEAVKAAPAAVKKAVGQQVKTETGSATATAKAAKAFAQVSAELYPKAKQEGNLIVYSVWDVEHLRVITDAFMKRYPGIKATFWQGRNPEIVTRALTGFQGGAPIRRGAPPVTA